MSVIEDGAIDAGGAPTLAPLATFTVFAYNQEAYVAQAVRGALAQQYRPLQVILSDDASTDRTFQVMAEAARLCPADVELVLNRNPSNTGIASHINKVLAMSGGRYVVMSAGDDISLPERTSVSVAALAGDPRRRLALHSAVVNIDAEGHKLYVRQNPYRDLTDEPAVVLERDVYLTGSSVTVDRSIYAGFPQLVEGVVNEDKVTAFRCSFSGGAVYVDQPLVHYRAGVGVSTLNGAILDRRNDPVVESRYIRTGLERRRSVLEQMLLDSERGPIAKEVDPSLREKIANEARMLDRMLAFTKKPSVFALAGIMITAGFTRKTLKLAVLFLMPWMFSLYKRLAGIRGS